MAPASSAVDDAARLLRERISELDSERARLERALASLTDGKEGRRGPGRPRGSSRASTGRKRRRSRKGGTRAEHAMRVISENPGVSASEIAQRLKMKPNYMYRVLSELQADGKVKKEGRAYHPS